MRAKTQNQIEQEKINDTCINELKKAYNELEHNTPCRRLRSCTAWIYDTKNYYVLRSYNTIIAVIQKSDKTLYDALRVVYGFTNTSCQHIAKFRNDYNAVTTLTAR